MHWERGEEMIEQAFKVADMMRGKSRMPECITPYDLCSAIVGVLKPEAHEVLYDGAFGMTSLLLSAKEYLDKNGSFNSENICGREINGSTYEMACKIAEETGLQTKNLLHANSLEANGKDEKKYDVVLSDPPFGMRCDSSEGELGIKTNYGSNKFLQHYINSLKLGGRAAIIITQGFFFRTDRGSIELRKYLIENCNLHTVLELPQQTFSTTAIPASVLFFSKGGKTLSIQYYLKREDEDYSGFMEFANEGISNDRSFVYPVDKTRDDTFVLPTASRFAIESEIEEKTKNFKDFKLYKLDETCLEINLTREEFQEKPNAVYLPKIGKSPCVTSINNTTLKHQNYFQLVLDSEVISNGYMAYYLRSSLGQMILEGCNTGSTIPNNITKTTLKEQLEIYAPNLEEQGLIASTFETLEEVQSLMEKTAIELSFDPNSAKNILEKLYHTKDVFNELSAEEKILKIIKGGENLKVEFKETLSRNAHTDKKDQNLQTSVLKNVVGFLNKNGGQLIIGVADNGDVKGIETDFYTNDDKYKLLLSNLINDRIGSKEASFIDVEIHTVQSKRICLINCVKAKSPTYLDDDFYIRTDPECRKLSTKEANEYIRENFK